MQAAGVGLPRATMPKLDELRHPLLGDGPTLQLMPPPTDVPGPCSTIFTPCFGNLGVDRSKGGRSWSWGWKAC